MFKRRKPDEPAAALPTPAGQAAPDAPTDRVEQTCRPGGAPRSRPAIPEGACYHGTTAVSRRAVTVQPDRHAASPRRDPGVDGRRASGSHARRRGATAWHADEASARRAIPAERRTLVVGRAASSVQGVVQDAERLVVEGTVEATMIQASELSVAPGGVFKGEVEVEDAEVAGTIDGTLTVKGSLIVRATGKVFQGTAHGIGGFRSRMAARSPAGSR